MQASHSRHYAARFEHTFDTRSVAVPRPDLFIPEEDLWKALILGVIQTINTG